MKFIFLLFLIPQVSFAATFARTITDGSYRQTVGLVYKKDAQSPGEIYCSGTLIGPSAVLTAAHCILMGAKAFQVSEEVFKQNTWIYIGDSLDERLMPMVEPTFKAARVQIYPQTGNIYSDLALLELDSAVNLDSFQISPAPLTIPTTAMIGKEVTSVGYGMLKDNTVKGFKTAFSLPLRTFTAWDGLAIGEYRVPSPSACHGDSGGSAYLKDADGRVKFVGVEYAISNHPCGAAATYFVPLTLKAVEWVKGFQRVLFE